MIKVSEVAIVAVDVAVMAVGGIGHGRENGDW